jgi:SAM-dependent methyltransferase
MNLRHRKTCRVCHSTALREVINLGEQHLQGAFVKEGMEAPSSRKIPCVLVRCDPEADENACGLLQLRESVPPAILYSSYWYRSGTNQTMRDHLAGIVKEALAISGPQVSVLDIGCNDGTLLSCFPDRWHRVGIDPSNAAHEVTGITLVKDVFPSRRLLSACCRAKFDIITSIAMFYDLEDPVEFAVAVQEVLESKGVWILEMSYMPRMLELNSYDTICHEHLEYYSLSVIENIMARAGLKVFRAELNEINGGSIRCYVTYENCTKHDREEWEAGLRKLRLAEFDLGLDTDKPYVAFKLRINKCAAELGELLNKLKDQGKRIHVYGASTKGNTILQWCRINKEMIECAADRNPEKYGASTLGTDIPIVSEEESRAMKPDYYLVLPWHFKKEFLRREEATLAAGTGFIFPLPEIEVIEGANR